MPDRDELLTARQVADLLGISVRMVRRYGVSGRLSTVRRGGAAQQHQRTDRRS